MTFLLNVSMEPHCVLVTQQASKIQIRLFETLVRVVLWLGLWLASVLWLGLRFK